MAVQGVGNTLAGVIADAGNASNNLTSTTSQLSSDISSNNVQGQIADQAALGQEKAQLTADMNIVQMIDDLMSQSASKIGQ